MGGGTITRQWAVYNSRDAPGKKTGTSNAAKGKIGKFSVRTLPS